MKTFNESIQIEVSIDSIAKDLLKAMNPEFKHAEMVVENIIGRMLCQDKLGLSLIYNSLNGYTNDINFKVGDFVKPEKLCVYAYWTPESIENNNTCYGNILSAKVVEIKEYANEDLLIEYTKPGKKGPEICRDWVNHKYCSLIARELKNNDELTPLEQEERTFE